MLNKRLEPDKEFSGKRVFFSPAPFFRKFFPQKQKLDGDQHQAHIESKHSQSRAEAQAEGVRDAGDRRGSQIGFCDKSHPKGIDEQPCEKEKITFDKFCFIQVDASFPVNSG